MRNQVSDNNGRNYDWSGWQSGDPMTGTVRDSMEHLVDDDGRTACGRNVPDDATMGWDNGQTCKRCAAICERLEAVAGDVVVEVADTDETPAGAEHSAVAQHVDVAGRTVGSMTDNATVWYDVRVGGGHWRINVGRPFGNGYVNVWVERWHDTCGMRCIHSDLGTAENAAKWLAANGW